jgi:hypothetical protein
VLFDRSALVAGDAFFAFLRSGAIDPWREAAGEQNAAVIEAAAAATGRLAGYCDVVYDGVLGPWFLEMFTLAAQRANLHYAVLLPPLEVCLARVSTRQGHGFTDRDAATQMWHDFARSDIDVRHVVSDPDSPVADVAHAIHARVTAGTIEPLTVSIVDLRPAFLRGGPAHDDPGPRPDVDPVVLGELPTMSGRDGITRQRSARRAHVRAVGRLEVLHPPASAIGGELRLTAAHPGVTGAVDLGVDVAARGRAADEHTLGAQRDDGRQTG